MEATRLQGACTHNLQSIDLTLRPGELVVLAGVSGSGKSSLALDTLYAEGQRRFVESFSAYARQFLERRERPNVTRLDPVPAAIAVDRGAPIRTSRSTVGTMTELQDHLRLLWARASSIYCDSCGQHVVRQTLVSATETLLAHADAKRVMITYRIPPCTLEQWLDHRVALLRDGYVRVVVDGKIHAIDDVQPSVAGLGLDVLIDRLKVDRASLSRVSESLSVAMARGDGSAMAYLEGSTQPLRLVRGLECAPCGKRFADPSPTLFSFYSPLGACDACKGFGRVIELDWSKVVADDSLSIDGGAIKPWTGKRADHERKRLAKFCKSEGIDTTVAWRALAHAQQQVILEGNAEFDGVRRWFSWLETKTYKMHVRVFLSRFRKYETCASCKGSRLRAAVGRYQLAGLSIIEAGRTPIAQLRAALSQVAPMDEAADRVLRESLVRLGYLEDVGLGYLTLERPSRTLSGGEIQRVSLTAALGTGLTGTLMVLDEPTVGLHPRDSAKLVAIARSLAEQGNMPIVVEHDRAVIRAADRVIELGPGAGERGGRVVFDGPPSQLAKSDTPTGRAMRKGAGLQRKSRVPSEWITLIGASGNNLRGQDVRFPLGVFTCVTGVSGSGKSTLVGDTLAPAVARMVGAESDQGPLAYRGIEGIANVRWVTYVDQAPLGRTSRGNAATYLGAWDAVRALFAALPDAQARGYSAGTFSFNVDGGRCEGCKGEGHETIEMQFLADVSFACPDCKGRRFRDEVLEIRWHNHSIADVLAMSVSQALAVFSEQRVIQRALSPLANVGLGYLSLGRPLSMLSGGEAQRVKLARACVETSAGGLVILDEPTAGLHAEDISHVLTAIDGLLAKGATVIAVEHDPAVVAVCDWVIDLGPEAADQGGMVVAEGTPATIARDDRSQMARFLREVLDDEPADDSAARETRRPIDPAQLHAIVVEGVREHNLAIPRLEIPRDKLVAFTGPSGSGKSSLAFDVIYAEGQRRFLETLSPYARQFLPSLGRADVDRVIGIPPAISLEQRTARSGAMSTVATVTEIAHYLRLLFAKVGTAHCPKCDLAIGARSIETALGDLRKGKALKGSYRVLAPVVRARKGLHKEPIERAIAAGIKRIRVDGQWHDATAVPAMAKSKTLDVALELGTGSLQDESALQTLLQRAAAMAEGHVLLEPVTGRAEPLLLSTRRACAKCGRAVPELDPRHFSFNTPQGRCTKCEGMGHDEEGAPCKSCKGTRLNAISRGVRLGETRFHEALACVSAELSALLAALTLDSRSVAIAKAPLHELTLRLATLDELGLDYLALDRRASTLSGGEMQRLRLAAQLGAGLTGVLYVLDEPTIGLHGRDTHRLMGAMRRLVERGASVLVVEHDEAVIRGSDWMIDMGPGGGSTGGRVVASGPTPEVLAREDAPTARALSHAAQTAGRERPVQESTPRLSLRDVTVHNLSEFAVDIPLGRLVAIAGVSGSGKSTLVHRGLYPSLCDALGLACELESLGVLDGAAQLKSVRQIDQSPIGRTPRSVPATYVGLWDELRKLFAMTTEARARGWSASRFSFNTSVARGGGRCEACDGAGVKSVEMSFLPDVVVPCELCDGRRFSQETCAVKLHGLDVSQVLRLTVDQAKEQFAQVSSLSRPLQLLSSLGLGYLTLGQGSHTLSGGEAQRIKLATELQGRGGSTLYLLDEPTTGLHASDVEKLISVLQKLVDRGDSVLVVEHHPAVLATADWLIELGPDGGKRGGQLVAQGPPSLVARKKTATGRVLAERMASR
ncbi:MAG: excinuclease ABC subunit UvrA [Deltaproteobacteria bacterium]|nr:excinuclease ABC subunit UvrA [Deltaproteobacteria bacterium]